MASDQRRIFHHGCICCYSACDFENILLGNVSEYDCLCIRHSCCCAPGVPPRGCGMVTDKEKGEICKIGCYCTDWGIIKPDKIAGTRQCCCCYHVSSLPFNDEYVAKPVCGLFYFQCLPKVGCCVNPPECKAMERLMGDSIAAEPVLAKPAPTEETMDRDDVTNVRDETVDRDDDDGNF